MHIRILEPDFVFSDDRGTLVQMVREGYRQVNYILSHAGVVRGGHYHRLNREMFYVISGEFELTVWPAGQGGDGDVERYTFGAGSMFEIPEDVVHSFRYNEETALVSMYTKGVELASGEKDIIKGEDHDGPGREDLCGGA